MHLKRYHVMWPDNKFINALLKKKIIMSTNIRSEMTSIDDRHLDKEETESV